MIPCLECTQSSLPGQEGKKFITFQLGLFPSRALGPDFPRTKKFTRFERNVMRFGILLPSTFCASHLSEKWPISSRNALLPSWTRLLPGQEWKNGQNISEKGDFWKKKTWTGARFPSKEAKENVTLVARHVSGRVEFLAQNEEFKFSSFSAEKNVDHSTIFKEPTCAPSNRKQSTKTTAVCFPNSRARKIKIHWSVPRNI